MPWMNGIKWKLWGRGLGLKPMDINKHKMNMWDHEVNGIKTKEPTKGPWSSGYGINLDQASESSTMDDEKSYEFRVKGTPNEC